jgi:hypothetical protein
MVYAGSLVWLIVGASCFGVATRLAILPAGWIALIALVHGVRSMGVVSGTASLSTALFVSLAIAKRDTFPLAGPLYFAIMAAETSIVVVPFLLDRVLAPRRPAWLPR